MTKADLTAGRTLPHNLEAERAVLGAVLYGNEALAETLPILEADGSDFYHNGHREVFRAVVALIDKGTVADLVTTCESLKSRGTLDRIGGPFFVASLVEGAISSANVGHYARIVREKAIERRIITEAERVIEAAYSPTGNTEEALQEAQRAILSLALMREKNTLRDAKSITRSAFAKIEAQHERGGEGITGLSTGLPDLDDLTLGLHPGELIVIAGRPGMGKTALAGNIALHAALEGMPVVVFSLEMPAEALMVRFLAGRTRIDSRQLRRGLLHAGQWPQLVNAAGEIGGTPLYIDDKPDLAPTEIRAKARRLKAEHGLGLVIVDYLQLMRSPGRHDNREQAVAEISRTLKAIARELEIPVIALSQLNRQVDSRPDKRPQLSDLRESGAIEQDADVIAFIYRDEVYNKSEDNPEKGFTEIEIAKHRNGPIGRIRLRFDAQTQTFRDLQE
jgi:replicative DNA helicase